MKFRTATIWIALVSTGMLCLAVGAVRIPRKPRSPQERSQAADSTQGSWHESAPAAVIPMRVVKSDQEDTPSEFVLQNPSVATATAERQSVRSQPAQRQDTKQQPLRRPAGQFSSIPKEPSTAGSRFGETAEFVAAQNSNSTSNRPNGFQEPEAWPFHRSSTAGSPASVSTDGTQQFSTTRPTRRPDNSGITEWPYRSPSSTRASGQTLFRGVVTGNQVDAQQNSQSSYQPNASYGSVGPGSTDLSATQAVAIPNAQPWLQAQSETSDDLLDPAFAFGQQSRSASTQLPTTSTHENLTANQFGVTQPHRPSLSQLAEPFGSTSSLTGTPSQPVLSAAAPSQRHVQSSGPSLTSLPAPQPSPNPSQSTLEAGHAGAMTSPGSGNQVVQAYAESVTPRKYVTAGQWSGPQSRPVRSIQQVSFDSCPDCEDVSRIPAESLINPYASRANRYPEQTPQAVAAGRLVRLPHDYAPWWDEVINKPLRAAPSTYPVNVESLILAAIEYSPRVTAFRIDPIIRETQILEEAAEFDWRSFLETKFDDSNDPVGNALTTGNNADRFKDKHLTSRVGVEKRLAQGGTFDVTQNFGLQDNNSRFLVPNQQGTSRLELNYTQPLLRGAGQTYNESRTILAMLDHQISEGELQESLQDHLLEVYTTYWNLYRARAVRLQKERLLMRAIEVEQQLAAGQEIDSVRRQVLRTRAAIASRRSEIVRADMEVRNAESRLRLLVNSPGLKQSTFVELLPVEAPMSEYLPVSMRGSVETALQNRPDIRRAITQMKETAVRLEVSKNELLPKMDLVLGTYVAGLRGQSQVDTAWTNQFRDGRPGYTVGLMMEYPLGNRAAKARYARREWEVAKTLKEFEASVEASMSEVELAVRELETSYQEMLSRFQSMIAADTEANYLLERWRQMPGNDQTTSFLLEDLLDAQERVAVEEQDFVEAQVAYVISVVRLKRASGILLSCDCGESPVSFMTPAPRGVAQPNPLPQPIGQRPALPAPQPARPELRQPSAIPESSYSVIPLPDPSR